MKLEWVVDFRCNKLEVYFIVNLVLALLAVIAGCFWDAIAKRFCINHHQGFDLGQIIWCFAWGCYMLWTLKNALEWGD